MKQRYLRAGDSLTDDVTVVVRGGTLDVELLREDALRNHAIYGTHGISVFAVGALRVAGLRLEPTGRNPRHFDITFADLDNGIARLLGCEHRTVVNPYHED